MRVCHMTSAHGVEDIRIFHKECVSLSQGGYEVFLVERGESYEKSGVHIVGVGDIPTSRLKRMLFGARRVYQKALEIDAEIYHLHDPELLPYGLKLKKQGKKVVFDSHEHTRTQILNKGYLPRWCTNLVSRVYGVYEDYVLRHIDGVIFPCPLNGSFPYVCRHTAYVNNVPKMNELYDEYDAEAVKDSNTVCMIGSLTYDRGVKHFVLAAYKAGCKALLGGNVTPVSFMEELRGLPESSTAEFLGYLNREQVKTVLKQSSIGSAVLLNVGQYSRTENLATKVYEYMSMGLPVLLTKNTYNENMVNQYGFGRCVDPENIDEYAEAIRYILDHEDEAKQMGDRGRELVREKLNWSIEERNLFRLYEEVSAETHGTV